MTYTIGVVMDPIGSIHYKKDSTLSMLWEAQRRGWKIFYFEQKDLFVRDGVAFGHRHVLTVYADEHKWFEFGGKACVPLAELDVILMRKDPPVDRQYIHTTYILELAEKAGALVINKPQSLRDANEKFFASWFPSCCPPSLMTSNIEELKAFYQMHQDIVCKPLDGMGGTSIFRLRPNDMNANVVFETLTQNESTYMMAQKFIPAITAGDKRILMINGEPLSYALARVPGQGEWRGNLAAGANGIAQPLTEKDLWICQQVGPVLKAKGLYFVGLDVIGDYLTEINVTSPTCIRELDQQCDLHIPEMLFDFIASLLKNHPI